MSSASVSQSSYSSSSFRCPEEGFDWRVVDAVAFAGHGLDHSSLLHRLDAPWVGVVEALVGVDEGTLSAHLVECCGDELHLESERGLPGHYLAARHVLHDREVGERVFPGEVGDVSAEDRVGGRLEEVSLEEVGRDAVFPVLRLQLLVGVLPAHRGAEPVLFHDPLDLLVVHVGKPHFEASPAVFTPALFKDRSDL